MSYYPPTSDGSKNIDFLRIFFFLLISETRLYFIHIRDTCTCFTYLWTTINRQTVVRGGHRLFKSAFVCLQIKKNNIPLGALHAETFRTRHTGERFVRTVTVISRRTKKKKIHKKYITYPTMISVNAGKNSVRRL